MSEDKKIKLSFAVDDASLAKAEAGLNRLIALTSKLADGMRGVHFPGAPGGSGQGGILDSVHVRGGPTPVGTSQNQNPVAAASSRLAGALADQKNILTSLARGSADAMRLIGDMFKRTIESQKNSLASLKSAAKDLQSTYDDLSSLKAPTPTESAMRDRMGANWLKTEGKVRDQEDEIRETKRLRRALTAEDTIVDPTAPSKPGGGGLLDKLLKGAMGGLGVGMVMNGIGSAAGMMGTEGIMYANNILAGRGQAWGGMYQRSWSGDAKVGAGIMAMAGHFRDPGNMAFSNAFKEIDGATTADTIQSVFNNSGKLVFGGDLQSLQAAYHAKESIEILQQKAKLSIIANQAASAGLPLNQAIDQFQGDIGSRLSLESQLGYGDRSKRRLLGYMGGNRGAPVYGQPEWNDPVSETTKRLNAHNILMSEFGPSKQTARASGSVGTAGMIAGGMGAGGAWVGLGGLAGQVAVGGDSARFLGGTMGLRNLGYLAAGAMGVGGAIGADLTGGGVASTGVNALAAFQRGMGAGSGGEDDLMRGLYAKGGLRLAGAAWGGGIDSYHTAMNFINAGKAFGSNDVATTGYLASVLGSNPQMAMQVAKGGTIPIAWRDQGITKEKAKAFMASTNAFQINLAAMVTAPGGPAGNRNLLELNSRYHGNVHEAIVGKGLDGDIQIAEYLQSVSGGMAAHGAYGGANSGDIFGKLAFDAGMDMNSPLVTGAVGGAKSSSRAAAALAETTAAQHRTDDLNPKMNDILASLSTSLEASKTLEGLVRSLNSSAGGVTAIFDAMLHHFGHKLGLKNPKGIVQENKDTAVDVAVDTAARGSKNSNLTKVGY